MEKEMKARIVHKHDIEANWLKASGFVPKQGEIIVYDKDSNCPYERIKIGDGINNVNILPFAHDAHSAVTPQDYGAKGDGSTDDTAAFQNALAANRVVFVPGGTYKLSGELVVGDNCQMELAQDVVLNFTQTSGNCITMNRSAFLKGNHATIFVPYGFTGHVINVDTSVHTNIKDVPPFIHWDPQWKTGRYLTDLNICKMDSNGLGRSTSGDSNGTAVYVCADGSATSTFIWGMNFSGLRIAGAFEYGIRAISTGVGYNHEMRIEAFMDAVKIGVSLENCSNSYISATVQPRAAADGTTYAEHGIKIVSSKNTDLTGSRVWDWNEKTSKWETGSIYQHIALYGACAGTILNDFNYHSLPSFVHDIREIIYTDTVSNFDSLIILQEPFTRWFKPVDNEPYFNNGSDNERLLLKKEQDALFQTDYIPAFTDQLAKATDGKGAIFNEIGYKKGYGWEIDGVNLYKSQYLTCTGFIPVKNNSVVNVKGMSFTVGTDYCRIILFDADFNKLMHVNRGLLLEGNNYFAAYTETEDGFTMIPRGRNEIAYVTITVDTSTVGTNPVIAVDEEIAYTQVGTLSSGIKVNEKNLFGMDEYEKKGRMVTMISDTSTDAQYPTAKAVYNLVSGAFKEQESVLYKEQTLTEEQKAQARANIGVLEPLIGSTDDITPEQVSEALREGRNITVSYTDPIFGIIYFTNFTEVPALNAVASSGVQEYDGDNGISVMRFSLVGTAEGETWNFTYGALANYDDIPTKISQLVNDSGFITSAPVTSVNNQTGEVLLDIPTVDQTIDQSSNNAISNKAVAQGLKEKMGASGNTVNHTGQINFFATGEWSSGGETPSFFIKLGDNNVIELVCHDSKGMNSIMIGQTGVGILTSEPPSSSTDVITKGFLDSTLDSRLGVIENGSY